MQRRKLKSVLISDDDSAVVTCGVKHINFWKHCGNALQIRKGKMINKTGEIQSQMCVVFGEEDNCFSGTLSGGEALKVGLLLSELFCRLTAFFCR